MCRSGLVVELLAVVCGLALCFHFADAQERIVPEASQIASAEGAITGAAVRGHIRFWASDLLEGRGPGSRGDELAQQYIAAQFESLGLKPAAPGGGWFQPVPLVGVTARVPEAATFRQGQKSLELKRHDDF